ncbi:MAG: HEPN domain-containing protein [Bacteroidales bacterium]|nr:HEPN domain-containing protein [Bacteroidales bacterium]
MKRDPVNEGQRWLIQSKSDICDARYLYDGSRYNACCFFCQQAAEKAIKAYLYTRGAEHVFGHSVAELCQEASKLDHDFKTIKTAVSPLDIFYIPTRYPNGLPGGIPSEAFSEEDAKRALDMAEKVVALVDKLIT